MSAGSTILANIDGRDESSYNHPHAYACAKDVDSRAGLKFVPKIKLRTSFGPRANSSFEEIRKTYGGIDATLPL